MKITVLDSATLGDDLDLSPLSEVGETEIYKNTAPNEVAARIAESDAVVINKIKLGESNLSAAKNLKIICIAATGYDNIDVAYCKEKGIAVCNVVGYSTHSVAQLTLAMALSLATHLPAYTDSVRDGRYTAGGVANRLTPVYHELVGKTWGILGGGNIGKQVARVAQALGCRVLVTRQKQDEEYQTVSFETLCKESDVLSIHVPLTDKTRHMVDGAHLALMKKDAVLINVARGAVTDEEAVAKAVLSGQIGAFGCDVYDGEPMRKGHPFEALLSLPNVILTPHMAWGAYEARRRCIEEMAANVAAFLRGERRFRVD
jgi:glycerate dehydrogenase